MSQGTTSTGASFWTLGRILGLSLAALVVVLAIVNFNQVEINFLVLRVNVPLFFLIVGVLLIGFVWGWLSRRPSR